MLSPIGARETAMVNVDRVNNALAVRFCAVGEAIDLWWQSRSFADAFDSLLKC